MDQWIAPFLLTMVRVSGMVMSMPLLGAQYVSRWVKVGLVITISYTLYAQNTVSPTFELFSMAGFLTVIFQWMIGLMLGFIFQIVAHVFVMAAQIIAMEMGLGFASMVDPQNGLNIPVVSQLYVLLFLLLFLAVDGHLYLLQILQHSFERYPIDAHFMSLLDFDSFVSLGTLLFANSLKIALPGILCLLVVNLALGVMGKAAPQLNLFSIGFPASLIFGIIILLLTVVYLLPLFEETVKQGFDFFESAGVVGGHYGR